MGARKPIKRINEAASGLAGPNGPGEVSLFCGGQEFRRGADQLLQPIVVGVSRLAEFSSKSAYHRPDPGWNQTTFAIMAMTESNPGIARRTPLSAVRVGR